MEENIIKIIDIAPNTVLPESFEQKLRVNNMETYRDTMGNKEHLYGLSLFDDFSENGVVITQHEEWALNNLYERMTKEDCSYFRIIYS